MHILAALPLHPGGAHRDVAERVLEHGGAWLDVHDAEAAAGRRNQWTELSRVMGESGVRIQFGGGIRSMTQVQQLLDLGVERVAVGTQAVENPLWLRELGHIFPGRVVLRLNCAGTKVLLHGGSAEADADVVATVAQLARHAPLAIQVTDPDGVRPDLAARIVTAAGAVPVQVSAKPAELAALAAAGVAAAVLAPDDPGFAEAAQHYPAPRRSPIVRVLAGHESGGAFGMGRLEGANDAPADADAVDEDDGGDVPDDDA